MPIDTPKRLPLPRIVLVVGVVSMLNDFASEMVIPLIPLLLVTVLAAGPVALGLIEGAAETLAKSLSMLTTPTTSTIRGRGERFGVSMGIA